MDNFRESDLVKLDIKLNGDNVDAFRCINSQKQSSIILVADYAKN